MPMTRREQAEQLQAVLGKPSNLCSQSCEKCAANDAEQLAAIKAALDACVEVERARLLAFCNKLKAARRKVSRKYPITQNYTEAYNDAVDQLAATIRATKGTP